MRTALVAALVLLPATAYADSLPLPKPSGAIPVPAEAFPDRPERLRTSITPGRVDDTERVDVAMGPTGFPAAVSMTQRLVLHGTGQFVIWQRSSAQDVEALEDTTAPVLKREAVIWQGFVSERKELAARLTLDAPVEYELLPLRVTVTWNGAGKVGPGGALPGPGEVTVSVSNRTTRPMTLPTGTVAAADLVEPLSDLLAYASRKRPGAPPMAGRGLPRALTGTGAGSRDASVTVPFRVRGTIRVDGGTPLTPESGGITHLPDGLSLDGVLTAEQPFTVKASRASRLVVELTAFPALDPRVLLPPSAPTWERWLASSPSPAETQRALTTLVDAAAAAARSDEYAPYLGHHGPGLVRTTYHWSMAPAAATPEPRAAPLTPKPGPIALASLALLGILANAGVLWRRL